MVSKLINYLLIFYVYKMKINFLKTINYTSVFFYLWIITLILCTLFKYGFDYKTEVIDPKNMGFGILYDFFPYVFVILLFILIPLSLIFSIAFLIKNKSLTKESLIFLLINCIHYILIFYPKFRHHGILFWLGD